MSLLKLTAGKRHKNLLPAPTADAFCLAELAKAEKAQQHLVVIITADTQSALRLLLEIPFFQPDLRCSLLPDWETLPYDQFSPHQDLISERLASLWDITQDKTDVLIVPASTALTKLAPVEYLAAYSFDFKVGQQLDQDKLKAQLVFAGYQHVTQVLSPGEFCVRGSLIDLFPMGANQPIRVDLFDDEIDSIRNFDPDNQRSADSITQARLLPAREFPTDADAIKVFRNNWRDAFPKLSEKNRIFQDISQGNMVSGCEYYLPLFFEHSATLFDYLAYNQKTSSIVTHGDVNAAMQQFWQDTNSIYSIARTDPERPALPPEQLFLTSEEFFQHSRQQAQLSLTQQAKHQLSIARALHSLPALQVDKAAPNPVLRLEDFISTNNYRVLLIAESLGRQTNLIDYLQQHDIHPHSQSSLDEFLSGTEAIGICVAKLSHGFIHQSEKIAIITETELFSITPNTRRQRKQEIASDIESLIKDLSELRIGDPVVHSQHGIGRYQGLVNPVIGQTDHSAQNQQEFLQLEYANATKLYVPINQLHLISRYSGVSAQDAPLHRLGGAQWEKIKKKTAEQIRDTAAELLNIYARRASRPGFAFRLDQPAYYEFANDFGFQETADQQAAIAAVMQDMLSPQPMDRLVCGDVGFGKTEVALRAAFIAVMAGKQVAFLAPTTLLAEQHYQTLVERFAKWPVRIAQLSRFRSNKEITASLQQLDDGTLDIVVGTHKLLSSKVHFNRLGLLIIDEEHRFGVRHKEAMKALRAEIDVLTLTATPIPRTLGLAFEGLRDLSVIATAPQRRLSIKTFVRNEDNGVIREAVLREIKRGGQVYFLHNEIDSIQARFERLEKLLPEARVGVAHGQMAERELEKVMRDFIAQRYNILLCSTIIETGIDVPNANTIIISRADRLGLAQLHQLRGRVGRSHHQAYAYLLVNELQSITKAAKQRLEAIQQMQELGSGFYLAMHDLEIRGAGEILGDNQSGNMLEVGFQLYNDMLANAVQALKNGREPDLLAPLHATSEINLHAAALLPNDYCGDVNIRLSFYKRLSGAKTQTQIDSIKEELIDRFGRLAEAADNLIETHRLRLLSQSYGITKIEAQANQIMLQFKSDPPIEPMDIIRLIQQQPQKYQLAGNDKLKINLKTETAAQRIQLIRRTMQQFNLKKSIH